jgi:hypothetical protein
MSEWAVKQWCRMFNDGRKMFTMESEVVGRLYWVVILFKVLTKKFVKANFRTFVHISTNFTHSSVWDYHRLGWHKFCPTVFLKMLTGAHKTQTVASALSFRVIPQRRRWILQSHCTSNTWWNLGSICECWNQKAVKAVDAHIFTKQAEKD